MRFLFVLIAAAVSWNSSHVHGSQLWGGTIGRSWLIDQQTGALIAESAFQDPDGWNDSASDPLRWPELIWGVSGFRLEALNPVSGQVHHAVDLKYAGNRAVIRGLAIDPMTGDFYGGSRDQLFKINPISGETSLIGGASMEIEGAMGFGADGVLYAVAPVGDRLLAVDTTAAAIREVATLGARRVLDLATRPEDGRMFAIADTNLGYQLITIDTTSGAVDFIATLPLPRPTHLAFIGVPELTSCSLSYIALAVAGAILRTRPKHIRPGLPIHRL